MIRNSALIIAATLTALGLTGCVTGPSRPNSATSVTNVKPETATVTYWVSQPATAYIDADNYDALWNACDKVAHRYLFSIDRTDYREGVLTTKPLISKYFTEFWRNDVTYSSDLADSSLATYRRTIRFELSKTEDSRYQAAVKVIVERCSTFERRVTTAIQYKDAFVAPPPGTEFYADDGTVQPYQNWYAVGRDPALEQAIAEHGRNALK